jgi:3,4-dihydroxy 2-butanone 4-phosphate synthase/GTP cyclohydrolase II
MGTGLLRRLQTLQMPGDAGKDATPRGLIGRIHETPGIRPPDDKRAYGIGCQILRDLGIRNLRLVTNHPFHPAALSGFGLSISEFVPVPRA